MPQFAFLLPNHPDRYRDMSEDEFLPIMKDYISWVDEATKAGIFVGGHRLEETGCFVSKSDDGIAVHDVVATELAEVLGGLMIVEARDLDHAIDLARSHPHLVHNERIEIRPIDPEA